MTFGKLQHNPSWNVLMIRGDDGEWYLNGLPAQPLLAPWASNQVVVFDVLHPVGAPPGLQYAGNLRAATFSELCQRNAPVTVQAPPRRVKTFVEKKQELRASILQQDLLQVARSYLNEKGTGRETSTVAIMWSIDGIRKKKVSGPLPAEARSKLGVDPKKETVCAEEVFLAKMKGKWLFSLSYDRQHGWKRACSAGCASLLDSFGIEDLADEYSQQWGRKSDKAK